MPLLSSVGPWDGLPDAAVNFALCQTALVAFFLGGQDGLIPGQVSDVLWGIVVAGAAILRCKPILGSFLDFCRSGRNGSGGGVDSKKLETDRGESELDGLLYSCENGDDKHDNETSSRLNKLVAARTNESEFTSSSHSIARSGLGSKASTQHDRHQMGTRNPHWCL